MQSTEDWVGGNVNRSSNENAGVEMVSPLHQDQRAASRWTANEVPSASSSPSSVDALKSDSTAYRLRKGWLAFNNAKFRNAYYNKLQGRACLAYLLVAIRKLFALSSIIGAFFQQKEYLLGECLVYSELGGFTSFPDNVSLSSWSYFQNYLRLDTSVCSLYATFDAALNSSMQDSASFEECGVAGYNATS